jgi:hypothetical protein
MLACCGAAACGGPTRLQAGLVTRHRQNAQSLPAKTRYPLPTDRVARTGPVADTFTGDHLARRPSGRLAR